MSNNNKKIPLFSWDGETSVLTTDFSSGIERKFGNASVVFNNHFNAVQSCLELLGSKTYPIPVIMPVTVPPDTAAAVLRSGALPVILDIDIVHLSYKESLIDEIVEELDEEPVFIVSRPLGLPVPDSVQERLQDKVTIADNRVLPYDLTNDLNYSFNIFDMTTLGGGSIVFHKFEEQIKYLKLIRSGSMGIDGGLYEGQARLLNERIDHLQTYITNVEEHKRSLHELLRKDNLGHLVLNMEAKAPYPLILRVPNAQSVSAQIDSYGIESCLGVYGVHNLPDLKNRYLEEPEYEGYESVKNNLIAIPAYLGAETGSEKEIIIKAIKEML